MSSFSGTMTIGGNLANPYPVLMCNIGYQQRISETGRPASKVRNKPVFILLSTPADDTLLEWMINSERTLDCHIKLATIDNSGTFLNIILLEAYCVEYDMTFSATSSSETRTALYISPKSIVVNGTEHSNNW
jgi:Hemolysin coregulated protein Hcp (TssD)